MARSSKTRVLRNGLMVGLECGVFRYDDLYLAECKRLGVMEQGSTEEEAQENLKTCLELFLDECERHGELEIVLKKCGVSFQPIHAEGPLPPHFSGAQVLPAVSKRRMGASKAPQDQRSLYIPAYVWKRPGRRPHLV